MKICLAFNAPEGSNTTESVEKIDKEMNEIFEEDHRMISLTKGAFSSEVIYEIDVPFLDSDFFLKGFFERLEKIMVKFEDFNPRFIKDVSKGENS